MSAWWYIEDSTSSTSQDPQWSGRHGVEPPLPGRCWNLFEARKAGQAWEKQIVKVALSQLGEIILPPWEREVAGSVALLVTFLFAMVTSRIPYNEGCWLRREWVGTRRESWKEGFHSLVVSTIDRLHEMKEFFLLIVRRRMQGNVMFRSKMVLSGC